MWLFPTSRNPSRAPALMALACLRRLAAVLLAAATLLAGGCAVRTRVVEPAESRGPCVAGGTWVVPATGKPLTTPEIIERAASSRLVLLGESHDRREHHLWQLQTIAALHGRRQHVIIGLEMFPRSAQEVLDQWVAGELDERRFLSESGWRAFWRLPADLYLPIFRFARMNRLPLLALNVSRELVTRLVADGWEHVPPPAREGLSEPAPATPEYERWLAERYQQHVEEADMGDDSSLSRFIAAQLVWDRAFAEALRAAAQDHPDALVIGMMGGGHLEHGYGVPHQLAALGVDGVTVLLPWTESRDCADLAPDLADAVFGVEEMEPEPAAARPLLGVWLEAADGGVAVRQVSAESVAAAAGMCAGDVIVAAAGVAVRAPGDVQEIVARQAPGTWLPLRVRRGREELEIVARFPSGQ